MVINIGENIRLRAKHLRIGPTELGKMIDTSKQNVYGIYKRKSINVEILRKLSAALSYDFFDYYRIPEDAGKIVMEPGTKYERQNQKYVPLKDYQKLKDELENLKEKYELLKR